MHKVSQHTSIVGFSLTLILFTLLFSSSAWTQTVVPIYGDVYALESGYSYSIFADSVSGAMIVEPLEYWAEASRTGFVIQGTPGILYHATFDLPPKWPASSGDANCAPESIAISFDSRSGYQGSTRRYFNPRDGFSFIMNDAGFDTLIVGFNASLTQHIYEIIDDYTIGVDVIEGDNPVAVHESAIYSFYKRCCVDYGIDSDMELNGVTRGHTYTLGPDTANVAAVSPRVTGIEQGVPGALTFYTGCGEETSLLSCILPKALYPYGSWLHGDSLPCRFSDKSMYLKGPDEFRNPNNPNSFSTIMIPFAGLVLGVTVDVPTSTPIGEYEGEVLVTVQYTGLKAPPDRISRIMQIPQPIHISVQVVESNSPETIVLYPNYPNPFNGSTSIRYFLLTSADVDVSIFNLLGQKLSTLVHERRSEGYHTATWEGSGNASGIYICRMSSGEHFATQRIVIVR